VGVQGERPELPDRPTEAALQAGWGWDGGVGGGGGGSGASFVSAEDDAGGGGGAGGGSTGKGVGALSRSHGDRSSTLHGSLSLVVRNCWAQAPEDRPEFTEVVDFLEHLSAPTAGLLHSLPGGVRLVALTPSIVYWLWSSIEPLLFTAK
jgi:hypothetical protein